MHCTCLISRPLKTLPTSQIYSVIMKHRINFSLLFVTGISDTLLLFSTPPPPQISEEWAKGLFVIKPGDEDIHTANERRLKVNDKHQIRLSDSFFWLIPRG